MTAPNPLYQEGYSMTDTTDQQAVTVAQEDRDAAVSLIREYFNSDTMRRLADDIESGSARWDKFSHAFARHRLASVSSASAEGGERYRHVKRGTEYEVIGRAELQVNNIALTDGVTMMVYRGEDGKLWVRGESEFMDGRFEPIATSPEPVPATNQAGEVATGRVDTLLATLFPEWEADQRRHIAFECATAALATQPATSQEGEVQQWRHKLWMVACHATGGGIPEIEGIDRSVNDICVQITQARNAIYQAGKDAALAATPTPPTLSEDLREAIEGVIEHVEVRIQDGKEIGSTIWRLALEDVARDLRAALAQVKAS